MNFSFESSLLLRIEKLLSINLDSSYEKKSFIDQYRQEIEQAHAHPLLAGGKRVRPVLLLWMASCLAGEQGLVVAESAALAMEYIHTYSLVHDDLPCMDNDDFRRGKPTTHKLYGDAKALLVGDGLLTEAFALVAKTNWLNGFDATSDLVSILALAAGKHGMVWGQWLDISFENYGAQTDLEHLTWDHLVAVHENKTGALLGACLEMGFVCGISQIKKSKKDINLKFYCEKVRRIGIQIGLVFQLVDDILDATQTSGQLGKTAGKDAQQNKSTAVSLLGLTKAQQLAEDLTDSAMKELSSFFEKDLFLDFSAERLEEQKKLLSFIKGLLLRLN